MGSNGWFGWDPGRSTWLGAEIDRGPRQGPYGCEPQQPEVQQPNGRPSRWALRRNYHGVRAAVFSRHIGSAVEHPEKEFNSLHCATALALSPERLKPTAERD